MLKKSKLKKAVHTQRKSIEKAYANQNRFIWPYTPNPEQAATTKQSPMRPEAANSSSKKNCANQVTFLTAKKYQSDVKLQETKCTKVSLRQI